MQILQQKMEEASENLDFEEAIRYRDLYNSVKQVAQKQKITDSNGEDKDIIALARDDNDAVVQVFFVRDGRLIGREYFYMTHISDSTSAQILLDFVKQFYAGTPFVPRELMLQERLKDAELWSSGSATAGEAASISGCPKRGPRKSWWSLPLPMRRLS